MTAGEELSARRQIATDLAAAQLAREEGKEGMARVCARRGAGRAISAWIKGGGEMKRPGDAVSLLRSLETTPDVPEDIRKAAGRLISRVNPDFTPAHPEDPIEDARLIIGFCMRTGESPR